MTTGARAAYAGAANGAAVPGDPAVRRATTLVAVILCLLAVAEAGYGSTNGGPGEALMVAAMVVLPLLYVVPASRPLWLRHRYPLLAVQAALTCAPFALFGKNWIPGPSGWLAGLFLLTVPSLASWLVFAALAAADLAIRVGLVGLPFAGTPAAKALAVWAVIAFVLNALILFGLARLANLIAAVHAARDELAEAAVTGERLRAADSLRAAVGDRLAAAAGSAAAAWQAFVRSQPQAREHLAETAAAARQALDDVREVTVSYRDAARPDVVPAQAGVTLAPRLAQAVFVTVLCGLAVQYVSDVAANVTGVPNGTFSAPVIGWTAANVVALVALQLRHSWPSPGARRPRGWQVTLGLQVLLTYAMVPVTGWRPLVACGFLAGSALLLIPAPWGRIAFAAVIASVPVLWAVTPVPGLSPLPWVGTAIFLTLLSVVLGLLVYALTRLAWLAVQLEDLRAELARRAVLGERLRVARDTHDLLGLGLSAIAMKADLIGRLIDRSDARAGAEIAELARICATARADMRLVTDEARDLPLDAELAAARDVLASAGIDVRASVSADLVPDAAVAVLVPVVREAVTNILKHSSASRCVLEMSTDAGLMRLQISNDGSNNAKTAPLAAVGRTGSGLANLAARVEDAGGRLSAGRNGALFSLVAEIPLAVPPSAPHQAASPQARP
ncbi:MAG TPA: histidine kinase [Streptosporangiaceae bacterium]|nr:histidine kinase [Streptosporangiaceae bacterium]